MQSKIFYSMHILPFCGGQQMPAGIQAYFMPRKEDAMDSFDRYIDIWKRGR